MAPAWYLGECYVGAILGFVSLFSQTGVCSRTCHKGYGDLIPHPEEIIIKFNSLTTAIPRGFGTAPRSLTSGTQVPKLRSTISGLSGRRCHLICNSFRGKKQDPYIGSSGVGDYRDRVKTTRKEYKTCRLQTHLTAPVVYTTMGAFC